jgi:hypothetical protein
MSKAFRAIWDGAKWDIGTTPDGTSRIRWWDDVDEVWHDVAHANVDGEWVRIPGAPGPELRSDVGFFDDGDDGDDPGPI